MLVLVCELLFLSRRARDWTSLSSAGAGDERFLSQNGGVCLMIQEGNFRQEYPGALRIKDPPDLLAVRLSHRYHSKRSRLNPPSRRTTLNGRSGRGESCREQAGGEGTLSVGGHGLLP